MQHQLRNQAKHKYPAHSFKTFPAIFIISSNYHDQGTLKFIKVRNQHFTFIYIERKLPNAPGLLNQGRRNLDGLSIRCKIIIDSLPSML